MVLSVMIWSFIWSCDQKPLAGLDLSSFLLMLGVKFVEGSSLPLEDIMGNYKVPERS